MKKWSLALFFIFLGSLFTLSFALQSLRLEDTEKNETLNEESQLRWTQVKQEVPAKKLEKETSVIAEASLSNLNWGLNKIEAQKAFEVSQELTKKWEQSPKKIVAIVDTGIDIHNDLKENLWENLGEIGKDESGQDKRTNKIDDDKNGYVDDVHGWNFVENNNKLNDNHNHGTHIAGIIGANGAKKKGIAGVAPHVSLMILKYYDPKVPNTDNLKNTIKAFKYAVDNGAQIINYSGGGLEYSQEEYDIIDQARKKNILFVAAAGNEKSNSDKLKYYPADYKLSNIISVTAINPHNEVLNSSNFGVETVHIAAPGEHILSTYPNNRYGYMTGTSQATAFVSGAAAMILTNFPDFKAEELKKYILNTGDYDSKLIAKTGTSRKLNLYKALTTMDQGVSLTGSLAENTSSMKFYFSSNQNQNDKNFANVSDILSFSKNVMMNLHSKNN